MRLTDVTGIASGRWKRPGGLLGRRGNRRGAAGGIMKLLDRNGDRKLQETEVPRRIRRRVFDVADTDGDRVLDTKELIEARKLLDR